MGLFDFVKDAGVALFGGDDGKSADNLVRTPDMALADKAAGEALQKTISAMELGIDDLGVRFRDGVVTLSGAAPSQAAREKTVLLAGNTAGVARVDDRLTVDKPEPEARMHTVAAGESLSRIAKRYYGDALKYPLIFEANTPMLESPDRIYPGQVLRIPPLEG